MGNSENAVFICAKCGAPLELTSEEDVVSCPYCCAAYSVSALLDESEELQRDRARYRAEKDKRADHLESIKLRHEYNIETEKLRQEKEYRDGFSKGALSKFLVVMLIISAFGLILAVFNAPYKVHYVSAFIAMVQIFLGFLSWLMGMQIIPEPRKNLHKALALPIFPLTLAYFSAW